MSLIAIRDGAIPIARGEVGQREQGGNNMGPAPTKYLKAVNLGPGYAWCCAFVIWSYRESTLRSGGGLAMPLPVTAKVVRLWQHCPALWRSGEPSIGAIYIHLESPNDPDSEGHCGIVTGFTLRSLMAIEGNTNATGSRLGDQVREHPRSRSYANGGYIDVGREGPVDSPAVA